MVKKKSKKKYNFIENRPLGKDLFEGKSHERTANVICDLIKEDQFQVIGIDGSWGVGKSNLVQIVDNKLEDHSFFIYDVWGHQEDEQRRSLLTELTNFITSDKNTLVKNKKHWESKLVKLLAKKREITTENLPYLSVGFIFSLLSIIYAPSVLVFKTELTDWFGIETIFWKLVLVLLPIFIVIGIYLWNLFKYLFKRTGFWKSFKLSAQETFQVYTNKQKQETTLESISENEPSVKDFQDWMSDIDNDLKNKKLVLVLDNFDRLPKQHILSVWSSVHVFFAEKKYESIKVIIPFDRKHIKTAFEEQNGNDSFANDYINKTFDIVFRVAPPILSSWKVFFRNNWEAAFPNLEEEEYVRVEQAYETLRPNITPREIVDFINNCVTLKLLDNTIPDRYIAVYLLSQEVILEEPLIAILDLSYLGGLEPIYSDDTEYPKFITALAYQIDPKNALEVVYRKQLKDCLINNETEDFEEIAKLKIFKSIINSVVTELTDVRNPILVLDALTSVTEVSEATKGSIWQTLYSKVKSKELSRGQLDQYQLILLKNLKTRNRDQWLGSLVDLIWGNEPEFAIEKYLENLDKIEDFCEENKLEVKPFEKVTSRATSAEKLKKVIDIKGEDWSKYKVHCNYPKIDELLIGLDAINLKEASFIKYIQEPTKLTQFNDRLFQLIKDHKNDVRIVEEAIQLLKVTSGKPIELPQLADADIHRFVNQLNIDDSFAPDLGAMRLKLLTNSHPNYEAIYNKFLNTDSEEYHKKVASEVEWYIDFDDLLVGSITFNNRLMKGVVTNILEMNPLHRRLNVITILKNLRSIAQANEVEPTKILESIKDYDIEDEDVEEIIELDVTTLELLYESENETASEVIEKIEEHYKDLSKEDWSDVFNESDSVTFLKLQAIDFTDWNPFALEEYGKLLIKVASTLSIENKEIEEWLIESFNRSERSLDSIFTNFRDKLIQTSINPEIFRMYISSLFKYGSLEERADDVVRVLFNTELLDDAGCVEEMAKNSAELKSLLGACSSNYKTGFRDSLQVRVSNDSILSLSKSLGFRLKEKSEDEQ